MRSSEWLYEAAVRAAVPALQLAAPLNDRLRRGVRGRRASLAALQRWAEAERDDRRPLVWLHAPSVGEALMAQAILARLRADLPELQAIFTYFSPSAERMAARVGADWHGYLPWDRTGDVRLALDAARPSCIAFVRTEVWPLLVREAAERGCPVVMVNGVLAPDSSRLGRGARMLLGRAYRRLDAVGVVSADDAACFALLGIKRAKLHVTGDARFDQVWERVEQIDRNRPLLRPFREQGGQWLVCGSTWPADEEMLIEAMAAPRTWRAVIAPHDPTPEHIERLEQRLAHAGLSHTRLRAEATGSDSAGAGMARAASDPAGAGMAGAGPGPAGPEMAGAASDPAGSELADAADGALNVDAVVVDRVGVLADLYAIADVAYVGGGFGTSGLHSVVEPAALGVPVVYGPRHGNAREADRLRQAGGGYVVADAARLTAALTRLFTDADARTHAGAAARRFVERDRGGAEAGARLIAEALKGA
ncbi:MAG TPA: glycosyltransferase N-terminal domain-containing protein [Longimicrobiales bacterium]|nr:glycosyltransferase N-terminal domain-containing protein [Longimicrobiales bacterium]